MLERSKAASGDGSGLANPAQSPSYPACCVCDDEGCEFCLGTYLARALSACLDGRPEAAIEVSPGTHIRADVVVRNVVPQAIENIEARRRLEHLRVVA
jgi:hypothetical protein